jgi:superfamily II DNA/RNA helicase
MPPTFAQLGVPESICAALARRGIERPFEIQAATIADALAGRDVRGRAPTGSGKTLAFGIPLVANVRRADPRRPRGLVLSPTRELAEQLAAELRSFAGAVRVGVVYGGVDVRTQTRTLRRGVDILVACPGRLEDLIGQGSVSLRDVDMVVVDEADRMADMGFLPSVTRLLDQTDPSRQTLLFSATLDGDVAELTRRYQHDPVTHEIGQTTPDITMADHRFWTVDAKERIETAARVITAAGPSIVFCRTRHGSDRVARQLTQRGISAAAFHGGHAQNRRTRALAGFANGSIRALVATDVAARGIHVDGVAAVIHYDPANDHKTYVHRSGRTARAGSSGLVVSLIQAGQLADTKRIQRELGLGHPITGPDVQTIASGIAPSSPRSGARSSARPRTAPSTKHRRRRKRSGGFGRAEVGTARSQRGRVG